MNLWSVNHRSTSPRVNTCWRYELGPVVNDAPHVPHAGGSSYEPVGQAKALAEMLERTEPVPASRGVDLNNLLVPAVYYPGPASARKRFALRENVLNGFASGRLVLHGEWQGTPGQAYDGLPPQLESLLALGEALSNIGGVGFIWVGEPENFSADFLDVDLLKEIMADPRWRAREHADTWDIDLRIITDWSLDFAASMKWKRACSKALRRIVVNGARLLLKKSGLQGMVVMSEDGRHPVADGPVIAWPYANAGTPGLNLLGGNGELLDQMGGLDIFGTLTAYLYQAGGRTDVQNGGDHPSWCAAEMVARVSRYGRMKACKLNMQAGTPGERAGLIRLAEDLGHEHLVLWTSPGHPGAEAAVLGAGRAIEARRHEIDAAREMAGVGVGVGASSASDAAVGGGA